MPSLLRRFLGFERLIGPTLVKLVYWVGLAGIAAATFFSITAGLGAVFAGNVAGGLVQLVASPAVGATALIVWRFLCELFMLAFLAFDRLSDLRNLMRQAIGGPDPDHPQF